MCLMAVSTIVITVSLNMQGTYSWMAYISITCIIVFIIGFALGLGNKGKIGVFWHFIFQKIKTVLKISPQNRILAFYI